MNRKEHMSTNEMLGHAPEARLLIINADDFGMCHAVNDGVLRAFTAGLISSCTLMVPCPWRLHALQMLHETPEMPFGVHLTAVSEQPLLRWGPVLCRSEVPTLVDEDGYFYTEARIDEFLAQVSLAELEREFRAQIEIVLASGLQPTHLDSHCGIHDRRKPILEMTTALALEYGLALRVSDMNAIEEFQQRGYPTIDHRLLDSYRLPVETKTSAYAQMLRDLPPGLTEWAVHPGTGNAELQAMMPSWRVRQSDLDFFTSTGAQELIDDLGIVLVDYRVLQPLWRTG